MLDATMHSSHALWLDVLDQPVQIEFSGHAALVDSARERAVEAWGELVLAARPVIDAGDEVAPLVFTLTAPDGIGQLLDQLSSRATLAGIEARSGELLMLHAAGLADPESGRVVACVAPSGTGKTTLSRAAAGKLLYVTDETVAVTRTGEIVRYPKPLSVKQHGDGWAPKSQHRPQSFGLEVADAAGLTLGAVVLIERVRDEGDDLAPHTAALPALEEVDLFDAIVALVSELSYLSRMPEPLHWLAETLLGVGGVRRLRYREAEQAIPVLQELVRGDAPTDPVPQVGFNAGGAASAGDSGPAGAAAPGGDAASSGDVVAASREESARWRDVLARYSPPAADVATPASAADTAAAAATASSSEACSETSAYPFAAPATMIEDMLIDAQTGRVLIFGDNTVRLVSSIAAATLLAAEAGLNEAELRECLYELFGNPAAAAPDAVVADPEAAPVSDAAAMRPDPGDAVDPVRVVIRSLIGHGLLG